MLHLSGFSSWTMAQLKGFAHPTALDDTCAARMHPEMGYEGIDISTGPLGQGVANAVGMAIANMNLRAQFNKPGFEVIKARVYCCCGDACLQEGLSWEGNIRLSSSGIMTLILF